MFNVLVGVLELPVDRQDLLTSPADAYFDEDGFDAIVPLDARQSMYNYVMHGAPSVEHALNHWLGDVQLDALKLKLMRHKIASAQMDVSDFSRFTRPMVPLSGDRWRADGSTVSALMREIAVFKAERFEQARAVAQLQRTEPEEFQNRKLRIVYLQKQLVSVGLSVKDLPWTGPEPTRLTYNRLVGNGDGTFTLW